MLTERPISGVHRQIFASLQGRKRPSAGSAVIDSSLRRLTSRPTRSPAYSSTTA